MLGPYEHQKNGDHLIVTSPEREVYILLSYVLHKRFHLIEIVSSIVMSPESQHNRGWLRYLIFPHAALRRTIGEMSFGTSILHGADTVIVWVSMAFVMAFPLMPCSVVLRSKIINNNTNK